jgi:hypothetical protein
MEAVRKVPVPIEITADRVSNAARRTIIKPYSTSPTPKKGT